MSQVNQGVFLDVDSSITERNLCFATDPNEEELNKIFGSASQSQCPSKVVKPFPGFCIKTREIGSETKLFVNICQTDAIPAPQDITEQDLLKILESDDETSNYRVPMSIGDLRPQKDTKGEEAKTCDVAIHPNFFKKIEDNPIFKNFFTSIVFEGLKNKHGLICHDDKIILKNKKAFGSLQSHRIQQREIEQKMGPLMEPGARKPIIETISSTDAALRAPEYRLIRRKTAPNCLIGEFKFPDVISANELALDVGEDRILLEAPSRNYLLDIFVPHTIRQGSCASSFNKSTKVLTVTMPLVGG